MLERGHLFLKNLNDSRGKIVKLASQFIVNGAVSTLSPTKHQNRSRTNFFILDDIDPFTVSCRPSNHDSSQAAGKEF